MGAEDESIGNRSLIGFEITKDLDLNMMKIQNGEFVMFLADDFDKNESWTELKETFIRFLNGPETFQNLDPRSVVLQQIVTVRYLGEISGAKYAVKGTGKQSYEQNILRDNHYREFISMRKMQVEFEKVKSQKVVRPLKVLGYVRFPVDNENRYEEYILMEGIPNAKDMKFDKFKSGENDPEEGISEEKYKDLYDILVSVVKPKTDHYFTKYEIEAALVKLGFSQLSDIKGDNVLINDVNGVREYVLIDQKGDRDSTSPF